MLLRYRLGKVKYFLADHLGSTNGLADASGNVVSFVAYDSFGNASGNLATRYQYTGREFDNFTGLHYYRARWYDGNLGRFISEDPIGFAGGDINLYGYVWNNPIKLVDPQGTDGGVTAIIGGGAAIGAGGAIGVAATGAAIGVGIGAIWYYSWQLGEYIAQRNYPEQFPETQTKPKEKCDTKPNSHPQPIPQPVPAPTSSGNRGRWTCNAKCHVNNFSDDPTAPKFCYGQGSGSSETQACQAAKDDAQSKSPRGTYTRHCKCTSCWQR